MKVYAIETIFIHNGAKDIGCTFYKDKEFAKKVEKNLREMDAKSSCPLYKEIRITECEVV